LKGLEAERAAEFHHPTGMFDTRKAAAVLDVFSTHRACGHAGAIANGVFHAHYIVSALRQHYRTTGAVFIQARQYLSMHQSRRTRRELSDDNLFLPPW
jgi:hypothetical protein